MLETINPSANSPHSAATTWREFLPKRVSARPPKGVPVSLFRLAEFSRVLRPGGRLSLWEPINRFGSQERWQDSFIGFPLGSSLEEVAGKLRAVYEVIQPPDSDPMLDFDERDLIRLAEGDGFFPIALHLDAEVRSTPSRDWDGFVDSAWNPNVPTLREAMEQALTSDECSRLYAM